MVRNNFSKLKKKIYIYLIDALLLNFYVSYISYIFTFLFQKKKVVKLNLISDF